MKRTWGCRWCLHSVSGGPGDMRYLVKARNRTVGVDGGRIVEATGRFDTVIEAGDADVSPGLINAHDHLHRNHFGRLGEPPYRNAYDWARHIQVRYRRRIAELRRRPRREALLAGAWKNLFAGVTTVVHHDEWETDFEHDFPLRVARVASGDSLGMGGVATIDRSAPYCLHLAEGVDEAAAREVGELDSLGLLTSQLLAVHALGLDEYGIERLRAAGAALVWCPSSNLFLFGRTAPDALLNSGIDVLLGSDSLLTGCGNLLDELRLARAQGPLPDRQLEEAVGATPARRLGLPAPSLEPGSAADLILLGKPVLEASVEDVALVVVDGIPRVARGDLVPMLNGLAERGEEMRIGSVVRWVNSGRGTAVEGRTG